MANNLKKTTRKKNAKKPRKPRKAANKPAKKARRPSKTETPGCCNAKTKSGGRCQHSAGHRTDHPGKGRCWLHGGKSPGAPKNNDNALRHGLKSAPFRPGLYPHAEEIRKAVDKAFDGKGDLFWCKKLLQDQIAICYDRMWAIEARRAEEKKPSETFLRTCDEQFGRWFNRAARLARQLPRVLQQIKKLGLEDQDAVYSVLAVPPEGVDFVPFRSGDLPFDTRSEFLREHAKRLVEEGKLDEEPGGDDDASE